MCVCVCSFAVEFWWRMCLLMRLNNQEQQSLKNKSAEPNCSSLKGKFIGGFDCQRYID